MTEESRTVPSEIEDIRGASGYARMRERVLASIDAFSTLDRVQGHPYRELREKVETNTFNLVVVGQFKRGKTYLINALLGAPILPVSVIPLTSIVTILTFGHALGVKIFFQNGETVEVEPERLAEFVTETGKPGNEKAVSEVHVTYPSVYLQDGVRLIDTPGVGSVYQHNTDVAYQYLPRSDAALFLLSVDQPASRAELEFMADVREHADKIFFLLNKIDYLSEGDLEESIGFSARTIREAMGAQARIFPLSAKLALEGKQSGSEDLLRRSGLPAFSEVLDRFLMHEKGKVLLVSVVNNLLRAMVQGRLEAELELRSLTVPLEELKKKVHAFGEKKREILLEKQSFEVLLDSEVARLVKERLDGDFASFREYFAPRMEEKFDAYYTANKDLPLKELNEKLEGYVIQEVQPALAEWHASQDDKLAREFQAVCGRFVSRMNAIVDELLRFSSRLFDLRFEAIQAESPWSAESRFYYKLRDDPVGLEILTTSITERLPGLVSSKLQRLKAILFRMAHQRIYRKRKELMLEMIEKHGGRMRHDFAERIDRSKLAFRKDMLRCIETTAEGIGAAIEKGMDLRARGQKEADARRQVLLDELARMDEVRAELQDIKQSVAVM